MGTFLIQWYQNVELEGKGDEAEWNLGTSDSVSLSFYTTSVFSHFLSHSPQASVSRMAGVLDSIFKGGELERAACRVFIYTWNWIKLTEYSNSKLIITCLPGILQRRMWLSYTPNDKYVCIFREILVKYLRVY